MGGPSVFYGWSGGPVSVMCSGGREGQLLSCVGVDGRASYY